MFNKSILVALILCACYLGAIQADAVPLTPALLTAVAAVDTVDQATKNSPLTGSGSGAKLGPVVNHETSVVHGIF